MFSPEQFLSTIVADSNDTKFVPVPAGEYTALVGEVKARSWVSKQDPSKSGVALDVTWEIDDAGVKALLGREKVTVKQGLMLDLTEAGTLDMGKGRNVGLGRLREAVDLNRPGEAFAPSMLVGRVAKIKIDHRVDGDQIYAEVKQVAKLA